MRRKVAIVEDNPDSRELMRYMPSESRDVSEYESGEQAIEGFRRNRPDLVLLDISLPHMDGPEIVRMIRSDQDLCAMPVIALTAHAMKGDREKYLAFGFNNYVTKPILDGGTLLRAIEHWLRGGKA